MHSFWPCSKTFALALALVIPAAARGSTITAVADTEILALAADNNFGNLASLTIGSAFDMTSLIRFDLSAFQNQTVIGNATLTLSCDVSGACNILDAINVFRTLSTWSESTVTFNNFGPTSGVSSGEDFDATVLTSATGSFPEGGPITFSNIPASVIQGWINNAASNNGFLLRAAGSNTNLQFRSRETGQFAPQLTFNVQAAQAPVPEPATFGLTVAALVLTLCTRARPRQSQ